MSRATYILALAAAVLAGCDLDLLHVFSSPPPLPEISGWAADEMRMVTRGSPPSHDYKPDLFAAANETISFQIVLDAPAGLHDVTLNWTSLQCQKDAIPASDIKVFRMLPVRVNSFPPWRLRLTEAPPAEDDYYDALVPVDSGSTRCTIAPADRLAFWVDVYVSRNCRGGEYAGRLTVKAKDHRPKEFEIKVRVYDFVLPDERPIVAIGGFSHDTLFASAVGDTAEPYSPTHLDTHDEKVMQGLVAMRQLMRLGHDHRLDLFDTALRPGLKRDIDGNVLLDWKHYDAVAEPYLKGSAFDDRLPVGAWPSPVDETWPDPRNYGGTSNPAYAATVQDVVKAVTAHFAELGAQAMVFHWPARGAVSQEQYDIFSRLGSLIKQGDPQAAILSTLSPALPDEAGITMPDDVLKIANMLAPAVQWSDLAAPVEQAGGPLSGRWFAPGVVPFGPSLGLAADPADPRALAWMTMKYGCKGLLLNEVLNWRGNVFDTVADAQTRLFYPGKAAGAEGILPSVRLKRLRRGLQDLSYLMLLRQHGRDDLAHNMLNSLVRYAGADARGDNYQDARLNGWVQDGRVWEHARAILIEEVENVINPSELSKRQLLQRRLAWDELYRQATTVRVEQVRTNVSLLEDGRFNASVMLDLYNELASPADVQIAVAAAPPGWNFSKHGSRIAQLEPLTSGVIALELRGSEAPSTHSGKFSMPLSIGIDGNEPVTMDAWMPLLVSSPLRKPVVIDGSLDDWPIRTGNSAGDFVLVGRRGRQGNGLAARQTQAFVLHDSDNLYIAFRCFEPNPAGVISLNDNRLRYEQLMLVAEDAVEILLDPGASAKGVEDLHHMVIKPNGVTIMRRGIACQPPLGKVEPWPAAVTVATSHSVDQWTAEIAIPLKSLGEAATQRLWRVNFARFSTQGGESSSWVPNARHFYDPRNLGTMILPPP